MEHFFRSPNRVISREEIVREAMKEEYESTLEENRVNNIIRRIRRKIEPDSTKPRYLQTARGHGFKLVL
jgi:DNA-binding response OmpR family regulator